MALLIAIVGLSSRRVGLLSVFAFPNTDGDVRSKWALFMCSSNFLGHVEVNSHNRHWNQLIK